MGYKINPINFRLGIQRNWNSLWFGVYEYKDLIAEDVQIRDYLSSVYVRYKLPHGNCYIKRWLNGSLETSMSVYNPPNEQKKKIRRKVLKNSLRTITGNNRSVFYTTPTKYKGSSFFFTIPVKNAQLIAHYISFELEKRNPFNEIIQDIMDWVKETKKFMGIYIKCTGRFAGEDRARSLVKSQGKMPYSTMSANIDYGFSNAFTIYGAIGVKVWLFLDKKKSSNVTKSKKNEIFKISKRTFRGNNK